MAFVLLLAAAATAVLRADDWPEWRGAGRGGVWKESGILQAFPAQGLTIKWRRPIAAGYAGPAVVDGRVFVTDFRSANNTQGIERVLALNERSGQIEWTHEWPVDYRGLEYASGPRATPTVENDRVYVLGAMGALLCLDAKSGKVVWKKDFVREFGTEVPAWGMSSAPIIDGPRLIAVVGGRPDAKVIAFNKLTGDVLWKALSSIDSEPGYSQPILIEAGSLRQLIVWHSTAVNGLDPSTGRVLWEHPFRILMNTPIATPAWSAPYLMVSAFFQGSRLFRIANGSAEAELVWKGSSQSEVKSDGLHALMNTPVIDGEHIYGFCSYGQLRCLRLSDGARIWETQQPIGERARNASAFIVRHEGKYFINNDRGELIIARLSPKGYEEISRTQLIEPTSGPGGRRQLGAVNWSHPAYANRHIYARNDKEILSASLSAH